jgi:signal transduction histidine kinase/ActR/RegA family two-component response regulator
MPKPAFLRKQSSHSMNLVAVSAFFSVFYWILESVRDVIVFSKGSILQRLFKPDLMSFWMRILIVCILFLFGIYAQSLRDRLDVPDTKIRRRLRRMGMIWRGLGFGALYWVLEALRDVLVFHKGGLLERLFQPDLVSVWMRLLAVCVMLLFSIYAENLFEERERAKQALQKAHDELEDLVRQRTSELYQSYEMLKKENEERIHAEDELLRVNRALKTLSQCNEVMVRAVEETALFDSICRILVDVGGYPFTWVGLSGSDGGARLKPVASASRADFGLDPESVSGGGDDGNPLAEVIRTGRPKKIALGEPGSSGGGWTGPALERGFSSCLVLPLTANERPFGAVSIFSVDRESFDSGEIELLQELADDLAFGVTALRTRLERNRAEQENEAMRAQLLHSQKMEAVGILAGGVAHDFNNLLTAIQVSADLGMLDLKESDPVHLTLQEIHQTASRAGDLARQLLLFSRKHPMEYSPMNLNQTVENLNKMLHRLIGEDVEIQMGLGRNPWSVMADRGTIEQLLVNIAVNARDAMPDGGQLLIRTANCEITPEESRHLPESRPGKFVRLTLQDSGMGMTPETLSRIFEPFFSTKGPGRGTGLGLSVVYGIVKQHEGWITVTSSPGNGARFDVYLPAVSESAANDLPKSAAPEDVRGRGERILLVEDENSVREYTEKALVRSGYTVVTATNADEAVRIFEREKDAFDLVFSDVVLPDRSGIELVEYLKTRSGGLAVLLNSGYTDQKSQWPAIMQKGFRYLQKPYSLNDLLKAMREVLGKDRKSS